MDNKFTKKQFDERFPDDATCLEEIKQLRFGDTLDCPKCTKHNKFYRVKGRTAYACSFCGHQIYPLKGSIFDHSSTSLRTWFFAIYLVAQTRSGMSAKTLERMTGVTYKCAFRMLHKIRELMADDETRPLFGSVEVDETYFHPNPAKDNRLAAKYKTDTGKRYRNSQTVFGMVERGGRAKAWHVKSSGERVLVPLIRENVVPASSIFSDEWRAYGKLAIWGFEHATIKHSERQYVAGETHTQSIENLWSNIKPAIRGVYKHVSPKYLQSYLNEYTFRFSHRRMPKQMFDLVLSQVGR